MSSQKIPMQDMPQVWSLHNSVLPKKSRSTLIKFISIKETKSTTTLCRALYTLHDASSSEYESEIEDTFCLQMKIHRTHISHPKVPKPVYLMANLAYCLQEYHQRNQYLWARLDTCADVNLKPMVVYCLMFRDPELKKLTPPIWKLKLTPLM